jgi:iron complex outermembrane receptor protein
VSKNRIGTRGFGDPPLAFLLACGLCAGLLIGNGSAAQSAADTAAAAPLEEIVVTAQKRSESLQRAPAAITVLTSTDLISRGVDDPRSFENLVPSAKFGVENNATQVFIRGVGSSVDNPWIPEAISLQLDGTTLPRYATSIGLYDLQRVEVLPGPQGTLYGSSSVGGIVNILTNRPTNQYESDALVEYGNFAFKHVTVVGNVPVNDAWSLRGAINAEYRDGYNNNGSDNENALAARLSSLYAPIGSDFSLYLTGNYFLNHYQPSPTQYFPYPGGYPYNFPPTAAQSAFFYPPDGYPLDQSRSRVEIYQLAGELNWKLGSATLTYFPGLLRADTTGVGPDARVIAGFPLPLTIDLEQFSNELRLANSQPGPFGWLAGLYQYYNKSPSFDLFGPNLGGFNLSSYQRNYAAFAQGTYSITDGTRLTLGGRYSKDEVAASNAQSFFPIFPTFAQGTVPFTFNHGWDKFNWKVGAEQDLTANSLLYANVQTGFNPGTFQVNLPDPSQEIQPQTMLGYTLGVKNLFVDSRLKINVEGFLYNYKDQIIQAYDLATGGAFLYNAPHSQIKGVQVDSAFAASSTLKLYAHVGYLDAKFKEFTAPIVGGGVADLAGYQLPYAPSLTASLGAEQTVLLSDKGSLVFRGDSYVSTSYWEVFSHTSGLLQPSYTKSDVSISYHSPNDSWDVGVWGKNLEDKAVATAGGETGNPAPYAAAVYVEPPRTFGVRFHVRLGADH